MAMNGKKQEAVIDLPESKTTAEVCVDDGGGTGASAKLEKKWVLAYVVLRLLTLFSSLMALSFMVTAEQAGTLLIYGFHLPLYSKWSFSYSFRYLVGISTAVAGHSFLQLLLASRKLIKTSSTIPSRHHAWFMFAVDQTFAYAIISAGSAAAGVTNLNRTGIRHAALPNFCKPLRGFCDHATVSIAFAFFTFLLLATTSIVNVLWIFCTSDH